MRELALERYMTDIDNGWVLRRAQSYRGRVQVEDEEYAGNELLNQMLEDVAWSEANFLLVREAARVIPHGEDTDLARVVRRSAIELAELAPAAEVWRVEIHTRPSATTASRLRLWLAGQTRPEVLETGNQLAANLDVLYGAAGAPKSNRRNVVVAATLERRQCVGKRRYDSLDLPAEELIVSLCGELSFARSTLLADLPAIRRLNLIDAMQGLETEVQLAYQELSAVDTWPRSSVLRLNAALLECAYGSGLLSAVNGLLCSTRSTSMVATRLACTNIEMQSHDSSVHRHGRSGTIRHTFAEALTNYIALDDRAARFGDDVLRGSPLWMLGDTLKILSFDVDRLAGSIIEVAGEPLSTAVALNSGIAKGRLEYLRPMRRLPLPLSNRPILSCYPNRSRNCRRSRASSRSAKAMPCRTCSSWQETLAFPMSRSTLARSICCSRSMASRWFSWWAQAAM